MILPVAILAGGMATRLYPVTQKIPKALLTIAGRPFIFHQLEWLKREGVSRVVLCVGNLADQIEAAVGDGSAFGLSVAYSHDGDVLLGTGGALRKALPLLGPEFFVLYGDSYLLCPFADVQAAYKASGLPALMTVLHNGGRWDKSNVLFRDGKLVEYNKHAPLADMQHIDYGLGVLSDAVLKARAEHEAFDLADMYHDLSIKGQLAGYEVQQRFYEIGSQSGIAEADQFLSQQGQRA